MHSDRVHTTLSGKFATMMSNYSLTLSYPEHKEGTLKIDLLELKKAAIILRALNHKLRQQILRLIDENKKITVTDIYIKLRLEQSVASQHLAILRKAGFVKTSREGKYIYYSINPERLNEVMRYTSQLLTHQ
jgi:DNA-binding transcriptional ArsR family regulator